MWIRTLLLTKLLLVQLWKFVYVLLKTFLKQHNNFTFTPVSMIRIHNIRHSKKNSFVVERPRTGLGLNSFKYLDPKLWSSVQEIFKNLKKDQFKYSHKNSCWASILSRFGVLWLSNLCCMQMLLNCFWLLLVICFS